MQHLFQLWKRLSSEIRASSHILVCADYDGTLTPIVGRLDEAVLPPAVREARCAYCGRWRPIGLEACGDCGTTSVSGVR